MKSILPAICLGIFITIIGTRAASSVEITSGSASHGTANCQAALPVFDGNIRKRPRAIANEGATTAFVTCDFEGLPTLLGKVTAVVVRFHNAAATTQAVSCTLVDAFGAEVFSASNAKSVQLATQASGELRWQASTDNDGDNYTTPSMSCAIAPGVEITGTLLSKLLEIGD